MPRHASGRVTPSYTPAHTTGVTPNALSGKSNRSFMKAKNCPLVTMGVPPGPSFTLLPDPIVTNTGRLREEPLVAAVEQSARVEGRCSR